MVMRGLAGNDLRGALGKGAVVLAGAALQACAVTSPYWGYVPASTEAAIPVQAWTSSTTNPVVVECATATNAHGSPDPGESAYIVAANLPVAAGDILDSEANVMHSASGSVTMPSQCWDYFGDYDFWQLNLRVSQVQPAPGGGTTKRIFSSFDSAGLDCLGSTNGAAASFYGFVGQGCEMTYLGEDEQIPYIVLRITGYENGLTRASARIGAARPHKDPDAVDPAVRQSDAPRLTPIVPLTLQEVDRLQKAAAGRSRGPRQRRAMAIKW
jgi:hypothetical protein